MNFETYIAQAWNDHVTQSPKLAQEFLIHSALAENDAQLNRLVGLVAHVMEEHLAEYENGIFILNQLKSNPQAGPETQKSILRSIAALQVCKENFKLTSFSKSDQVRILAVASSALSERDLSRAQSLLVQALDLAESGLEKQDPAYRALAVTGNNLACAFEEKVSRSAEETEFMILAAQIGRKYWELAGSWLEVSWGEHRLTMTYLQAKDFEKALQHAQICVKLCQENKATGLDLFYAYEALASAEKARVNESGFQKAIELMSETLKTLDSADKEKAEMSLQKLRAP